MYERLIFNLTQLLRGTATLEDSVTLALQLLAWARLSELGRISSGLRYRPAESPRTIEELAATFHALANQADLNPNAAAFSYLPDSVRYLRPVDLLQLFATIGQHHLAVPSPPVALADYLANLVGLRQSNVAGIPPEVADLMLALAQLTEGQEVYLPFEADLQLTYRAQQYTPHTFSTSQHRTLIPWLVNILSDTTASVYVGDELSAPVFGQQGQLTQFTTVLALPPFGVRVSDDLVKGDYYGRFPEPTTSFTVLAVRHMLASTQKRAVIGVPNGLLFSPGGERSLREYLLNTRVVEGVIALPPALLPGSAVQFSLLVLNTETPQENVFFIDGAKSDFFERDGKGRSLLSGWQTLRDIFLARQKGPFSRLVAAAEVLGDGTNLLPSRYCLDPDLQAAQALLSTYRAVPLLEVVQFVRPAAMIDPEGGIQLPEVGPGDFPEFGYLPDLVGRTILTSEKRLAKGQKQFLQGHDIIIALKGAVGKVALVDQQVSGIWLAGLACMILRVRAPEQLDARVLFAFLKSPAGQSLLKQIVSSGSTVPLIQLRDLEKLRIPVPAFAEQQGIVAGFEQLVSLEQEILHLRKAQAAIAGNFWTSALPSPL